MHFLGGPFADGMPGNEIDIPCTRNSLFTLAHKFADDSFDPIANHRIANLFADRYADARAIQPVFAVNSNESGADNFLVTSGKSDKIFSLQQSVFFAESLITFRY